MNEAVKKSGNELKPWMPWAQTIPTAEESEIVIRRARLRYLERTDLMLLLIHKDTGQLIGSSGLHRIDWESRKFEIGYWARTSFSGNGYITEAAEAITNFAVHELEGQSRRNTLRFPKPKKRAGSGTVRLYAGRRSSQ